MTRHDPPPSNGNGTAAEDPPYALVAVLEQLRHGRSYSRPQIARHTGLSRSVVADRVAALLDHGLVEEPYLGPSGGGRAPRMLRFRARAGHLAVADVGASSIAVGVTDLRGEVLAMREEPADVALGPERILGRVEELFDRLVEKSSPPGSLWGIGIGVPGPVDVEAGRPVAPPVMPGWDAYPVAERLRQRYHVPARVDNDVNVMALAELRFGVAQGHDTVIFVKIGLGVGAGIVCGGRLHRGAQGAAGDVGHIGVGARAVCRCGKTGCLEAVAGGAALARDGLEAARDGRSPMLAEILAREGAIEAAHVAEAASHGDPVSRGLIAAAGRHIGHMLENVVNLLNPSMVVIGGGVASAGDPLLAAIRQAVYGGSLPLATRDLVVQRSALGGRCGLMGAAALVADHIFAPEQVALWLKQPARPLFAATSAD